MAEAAAAMASCHLSVIIPAYNEELRLRESLPIILAYLNKQPYTWELVIVDDGSSDRTSDVARELCSGANLVLLRNQPNLGKGGAIKRGMMEAHGEFRLFSDADLSTPMDELDKFWPAIEEGYAVVIGSRALPDSDLAVRQSLSREFAGRLFNAFVQTFLVPGLLDTQCGFKLFSAKAAQAIFPLQQLNGFAFDVEILMLARKQDFRIKEMPVRWVNSAASKVSMLKGLQGFYDLFCLRWRKL